MCNLISSDLIRSHPATLRSPLLVTSAVDVCVCELKRVFSCTCVRSVVWCVFGRRGSSPRHLPVYQPDEVSGMDSLVVVLVNMFLSFFFTR